MIKISIYDDHHERRVALKLLIDLEADLQCVADYPDCSEVLENNKEHKPDIVLMDIDMPGIGGIAGVKLIKANHPEVMVIMQTVFDTDDQIFNSILAGADGYILKTAPPEKLIAGIYEVAQGGSAMTASVARRVMELFRTQQQNPQKEKLDLTDREIEVLNFLSRGLSQKMVAAEMQISSFTVNNHLKKIYQKLHVHSAPEAIAVATKKRII
jgi:DNA-binding NarL/FixJ family response regulator